MNFFKNLWEQEDVRIVVFALSVYMAMMVVVVATFFVLIKLLDS